MMTPEQKHQIGVLFDQIAQATASHETVVAWHATFDMFVCIVCTALDDKSQIEAMIADVGADLRRGILNRWDEVKRAQAEMELATLTPAGSA